MISNAIRKGILPLMLACFAGTVFAGTEETTQDAMAGKESAQRELAARYASGNDVVKDALLSEQWLLRADSKMSARSGGDALAALRKNQGSVLAQAEATEIRDVQQSPKKVKAVHKKPDLPPKTGSSKAPAPEARVANVTRGKEAVAQRGVELDDFQTLLRAASQGNRMALEKFRTDLTMRNRLQSYAKSPSGKRDPFVPEVLKRLKSK